MLNIHKKRMFRNTLLAGFFVLLAGAVGAWWAMRSPAGLPVSTTPTEKAVPAPTVRHVQSRMLVMGDVYWGRYVNDWSQASTLKYAYPFHRLGEFERGTYNAWIANMECPLTNNPKVTSRQEDEYLKFDCSPAYLPEASKWFTAFSLANNHTDNQGAEGFAETKQHLETHGIQYFGSYDPEDYDNICNVLSIPATVEMSDGVTKQGKLPLVWCGYHGVFKTPSPDSIAVMQRYHERFNIVAMPHSGAEYKSEPDEIKTTLYRALIDGGADVVLGDHPHWVQTTESYKGHLIVYSMGNFIFDQQVGTEMTRSAVVSMRVSSDASEAVELDKWLSLGESCGTYTDDCLAKANEQNLGKLQLKYHFTLLGGNDKGKIAHRATGAELESIRQRARWAQTVKGLSGVYSGE